jgi:hypothetical protein
MRPKMLFYDGDTLDESPPVPLRPIRGDHFVGRRGFVSFINPGADRNATPDLWRRAPA